MANLPLRNRSGLVVATALLDEEDFLTHGVFDWHLSARGYAVRTVYLDGKRDILLHRAILGLSMGDEREGDHRNRDRLDNRRSNLRIVTRDANRQNVGSFVGSSSRHRGVAWSKSHKSWQAYGRIDGHLYHLGRYKDEDEAGQVAAAWRAKHMPFSIEGGRFPSLIS